METVSVRVTKAQKRIVDAMQASRKLQGLFKAMVAVAENGKLPAKTNRALEKASKALPERKTPATHKVAYADLSDTRKGFAPHRAYLFSVAPSKGTVLDELKTLLGKEAANRLAEDWKGRCNLNQTLPATQVALFLDSNNKARNREDAYADPGGKTTQEEDFNATGHQFAGDLAATLLCARIFEKFKKAQGNVSLSKGGRELYDRLHSGRLRSFSGALGIDDGRLRADYFHDRGRPCGWALGSPRSRESK